MNEMQLLERLGADVEPDPAALLRARRRLLRHALAAARPRRRFRVRGVLIATVAAAATVLVVLVLPSTQDGGGAEAAAARVLDRAARHAETTPIGMRQWLLVRSDTIRWHDGQPESESQETWVPGDPTRDTRFRDSDGLVYVRPLELPVIATDPDTDVDDIYAWLMRDNGDLRGADAAFERAGETLADDATPSTFKALLFEAITRIDGVRVVSESTDFVGHEVVLLGRHEGGGDYETQLAFDVVTGEFVGFQGVADGRLDYQTLMASEIVDALPRRARTCMALGNEIDGFYAPPGCAGVDRSATTP